jgi:hypothetical protein
MPHHLLQAQDGSMNLADALEERLRIINCTPADVRRFVDRYPPDARMTKVRSGRHRRNVDCTCRCEAQCRLHL